MVDVNGDMLPANGDVLATILPGFPHANRPHVLLTKKRGVYRMSGKVLSGGPNEPMDR